MNEFDIYQFDITAQLFISWFMKRARRNQRDAIDNLGKRLIADRNISRRGSLAYYRAMMSEKRGYTPQELVTLDLAWTEMREERTRESEK